MDLSVTSDKVTYLSAFPDDAPTVPSPRGTLQPNSVQWHHRNEAALVVGRYTDGPDAGHSGMCNVPVADLPAEYLTLLHAERDITGPAANAPAPDDTDANEAIAEATTLTEAIFEIGEKYDVPLTSNTPRWQDGTYLRHAGDFTADIRAAIERHQPLSVAALTVLREAADRERITAYADEQSLTVDTVADYLDQVLTDVLDPPRQDPTTR